MMSEKWNLVLMTSFRVACSLTVMEIRLYVTVVALVTVVIWIWRERDRERAVAVVRRAQGIFQPRMVVVMLRVYIDTDMPFL